jgi:2-keto-3-deoxy-L-arabinonate dehydratase
MPAPRFTGVYPILYAFFDGQGRLDIEAMRAETRWCLEAGAHGIAVLGNVTEYMKLQTEERLELMRVVGEEIAGRVPYAVTIGEPSIQGQRDFARAAKAAGADWVILQPPQIKGIPEVETVRFLGAVADGCDLPVAIQNNPVNMEVWLSNASLIALHRNHPNVTLMKAEGPAATVAALIEATGGGIDVFAGQGGIEYISNLRSGCAGLIPATDCLAQQVRIFELWQEGTPESRDAALRLHERCLPLVVLATRHLHSHQIALGKHLLARRLGLGPVHPRAPAAPAPAFALAEAERLADRLDGLPRDGG